MVASWGMMSSKASLYIAIGTVIGVVAGAVVGYFAPGFSTATGFIGELFLAALRLVVLPLIVVSMVLGIGSLMTRQRVGRTLGATLVYFVATTAVAIVIGLVVVNIIGPGDGVDSSGLAAPEAVRQARTIPTGEIISTLFPGNPLVVLTGGRYFALIFFSFLLGAVLAVMGPRRRPVLDFFRSLSDAVMTMIQWVMYAAPIGLFFLIGGIVAQEGTSPNELFLRMGPFLLCLAVGLLIHAVVVLPLALKLWGNRSIGEYFVKLLPAFGTVLGTNSPTATLPATFHSVVGDLKVDNRAASTVLPLGATMNLNATAMWVVMGAFFAAQSVGFSLGLGQVLIIALATMIASFVTAGVPAAGLLIIAVVFDLAGMPEAAFGALAFIAATDWLTERLRNAVDVWSDAVGASVVAGRLTRSSRGKPGERQSRGSQDQARQDRSSRRDRPQSKSTADDRRGGRGRDRSKGRPERQDKERSHRSDRRSGSERRQRDSRSDEQQQDRRRQQRRRDDRQDRRRKQPEDQDPFTLKQDDIVDLEATPEKMAQEVVGDDKQKNEQRTDRAESGRRERASSRQDRQRRSGGSGRPDEPRNPKQAPPHIGRGQKPPSAESNRPPTSSHRDDRSVPEAAELGPDLMERERARMQDQMKQLDESHNQDEPREQPRIDFSAEDWDAGKDRSSGEEARPAEEETAEQKADSEPAVQEMPSGPIEYGRTKHKRGWGVKESPKPESGDEEATDQNSENNDEESEGEELKAVPDSFSVEEQNFGRTKKKRGR